MRVHAVLNSHAFLPGDMVYCVVTVQPLEQGAAEPGTFFSVHAELHGVCRCNPTWTTLPAKNKPVAEGRGSLPALHTGHGDVCPLVSSAPTTLGSGSLTMQRLCEYNADTNVHHIHHIASQHITSHRITWHCTTLHTPHHFTLHRKPLHITRPWPQNTWRLVRHV
jgi:hypothetical protein